jgi:hypothetical protein
MNKPDDAGIPGPNASIRALARDIAGARDPQIMRIVAMVDALIERGPADALIAPLRQRLRKLQPPRKLRFGRLLFHPLDPLIVPAARWRPGQTTIPRTALITMAEHVRLTMGSEADAIETRIAGHTGADADLIARLGKSLWPAAARILREARLPETWPTTGLGEAVYRPLADAAATLLDQAASLDGLCAGTANGLLPPRPEAIGAMLSNALAANPAALPMLITLLLVRLPAAASLLSPAHPGPAATAMQAAMDQAADCVLRQLDEEQGTDARIAPGTLADAGAAVGQIATLLAQLDTGALTPRRRAQLHAIRQRLDAGCRARFASGMQEELLMPLGHLGIPPGPAAIAKLESAARGLRVLQTEGRTVGSGATYDRLLTEAADAIKGDTMRDRLSLPDQLRLVEILAGSDAALAMLGDAGQAAGVKTIVPPSVSFGWSTSIA